MEDRQIVELYWQRSEDAIAETAAKYGGYLYSISYRILTDSGDAGECVNDTYSSAWEAMPPHRPSVLSAFLARITRRISIDRWRRRSADKRGGGEIALVLDELAECVSGKEDVEKEVENRELQEKLNRFIRILPEKERQVFMLRYWYMYPVAAIAEKTGRSETGIRSMLYRTRKKLRALLEKEGY